MIVTRKTLYTFTNLSKLSQATLLCLGFLLFIFPVVTEATTTATTTVGTTTASSSTETEVDEGDDEGGSVCGTIEYTSLLDEELSMPILDCEDPFSVTDPASGNLYKFTLADTVVENGQKITMSAASSSLQASLTLNEPLSNVFSHDVRIFQQTDNLYQEVFYEKFSNLPADFSFSVSATGTYHMLVYPESAPIMVQTPSEPWWKQIVHWFIQPVYALYEDVPQTVHYEFTIEHKEVAVGPPSVLFLPGIQASRLYRNGEEQVWPPTNNDDVRTLAMTEAGASMEDIRTEDVVDEVLLPLFGANVYKSFLDSMHQAVEDGEVAAFSAFPYDWRYSVRDIVAGGAVLEDGSARSLIDEVERLADQSGNGQVAIVAHSNGGLLAKALSIKLEEEGKADLLDSITFLGVPHLGTPKALATLLHGYDQEYLGGLVVDDVVARSVIRNMPGAYPLLPSERYLELFGPTVYFSDSTSTAQFVTAYDYDLNSVGEYKQFLLGNDASTRTYGESSDIHIPSTLNASMLEQALDMHQNVYDSWTPPNGVAAYNLVGTGVATPEAIRYRELEELRCPPGQMHLVAVCSNTATLKPFVQFTTRGDKTVVSRSAAYGDGVETVFIDLIRIESDFREDIKHFNLTESDVVLEVLRNIFNEQSLDESEYVFKDEPVYNNPLNLAAIDSPVTFLAVDTNGNQTGRVIEGGGSVIIKEIPGSAYFEIGETKYLLIPEDVDYTMTLAGEEDGYYTYSLGTIQEGEQTVETMLRNATTTKNMVATYSVREGETSSMQVDFDGDGEVDLEQTLSGEIISTSSSSTGKTEESEPTSVGGGGTLQKETPNQPAGEVAGVSTETEVVGEELLHQLVEALERYLILLKKYEDK